MEMWKCHTRQKQVPIPDEDSQIFWEGCRRQRLLIQQCDQCASFRFPPRPLCPLCLASLVLWQQDPGRGEVLTFCTYHDALAGPAWQEELPYTVGVVQLNYSRVKMLSNIVCEAPQEVWVGMPVQIGFEPVDAQITLPKFYPV